MDSRASFFSLFVILQILGYTYGIRITKLVVPDPMVVGQDGYLDCKIKRERSAVYSLKWYIGKHEFYRWTPKLDPPTMKFDEAGLDVDLQKSKEGRVKIRNVTLANDGILTCEVSGEGPNFQTDMKKEPLRIVDFPDSVPIITGVKPQYQNHEHVIVNCTSRRSKPAAFLRFFINGEAADESLLNKFKTIIDKDGLETSTLGMRFSFRPLLVHEGVITVKCVAEIKDTSYMEISDALLYSSEPYVPPKSEGRASFGFSSSRRSKLSGSLLVGTSLLVVLISNIYNIHVYGL